MIGDIKLNDTVEAGGKVSYDVADLAAQFNAEKSVLIKELESLGYYKKAEALLNKFGLSLEEDYLKDGSIDAAQATAKAKEVLAYLEANQNNEKLQVVVKKIKTFLEQFDVIIDKDNLSVTGKVTVKAGTLGATEYTVTIKY